MAAIEALAETKMSRPAGGFGAVARTRRSASILRHFFDEALQQGIGFAPGDVPRPAGVSGIACA